MEACLRRGMDGIWKWVKQDTYGVKACDESALASRVREAQWWHWSGGDDRWVAAGHVLAYKP